jgi:hypothetical protein
MLLFKWEGEGLGVAIQYKLHCSFSHCDNEPGLTQTCIVTKARHRDFVAFNQRPERRHLARLGDVIVEESATSGLLLAFQGTRRDAVYWC